ncbi:MAG: UDP-N-acetylenolpyruvoylglucosamine reductase [Actinomycetota bacterium]
MSTPHQLRRPATSEALEHAFGMFGSRAKRNVDLSQFTTYKVGGTAALHMMVSSIDDLYLVSAVLAEVELPILVIGRGSNLLISDSGFKGLAITMSGLADYLDLPNRDEDPGVEPIALFGGSVALPVAARQSVARGLTGFEWGVGVPGSVGGAVRMNAGGHGSDMASSLTSVRIFHLRKGREAHVNAVDLGLRFRGSALDDHHVVLSATVDLEWSKSPEASEAELQEVVRWRRENQPGGQNAGSVFVNPEPGKVSAGAVIDELGMRGMRVGSAQVSEKHANFIQADVGGNAQDVVALMAEVRRRVRDERGYVLRSEIRLIGFEDETDPVIVDLINKDSEIGVSTIRLEQVFDRSSTTNETTDGTIPVSVLNGEVVRIIDSDVSDEVLEELRDAFGRDATIVPITSATSNQTSPTLAPSNKPVQPAERVVIVDDDLRIVTDDDFPADTMSQSVHRAPTSTRVAIFDDESLPGSSDDSADSAVIIDGTAWTELSFARRVINGTKQLFTMRGVNRRKQLLVVGSSLVASVVFVLIVLASPLVAVRNIDIEGAKYANATLIETVSKSLRGKSVLTVDTNAAQKLLETDPWIESVRIKTYLPSRAVIEINERVPVAWFLGVDNQGRVIDQDGRVLAVVNGRPTEYMLIDGIGPNLIAGAMASESYKAAAQLAISLPDEIRPVVKNMGVNGPNQVTMTLLTGAVVKFGEPEDLRNKLVNVVVILRRQDINQIAGIDVSSGTPVVSSP